MIRKEEMKISQIRFVTNFKLDEEILLSCGPSLQKVQKSLNGKLITLNVPKSAPPETPRAIIKSSDTLLNICLNRFDIITRPPAHIIKSYKSSGNFARTRMESILNILYSETLGYEWEGIITIIEYPENTTGLAAIKIVTPIFDKLVNVSRDDRDLASFQLQFGFAEDSFFKNFTLNGYENRDINLKINVPIEMPRIRIDVEKYPISESGLQITIDINNKPQKIKENPIEDFNTLLVENFITFDNLEEKLNLEGILT